MLDKIGYVREPAGIPQNMREGIIRGCIPTSLPDTALGLKVEYIFIAKKDAASGYRYDPGAMLRKIKLALSAAGIPHYTCEENFVYFLFRNQDWKSIYRTR